VSFNCTPDTVAILDFGNIGPPYPVGPATVTLNYIAFKGASPPPRVNCNVVASSQDPPSIVTPTGVIIGFADSMLTMQFDADAEATYQVYERAYNSIMSYAMISPATIDQPVSDAHIDAVLQPLSFYFDVAHTEDTPLDMVFIRQVLDLDRATIHMLAESITVQPGEPFRLTTEWMPSEPGEYVIRTFLWDSLDHPTIAYSPAVSSEVSILPTRSAEWWADRPSLAERVWDNLVHKGEHPQCGDFAVDDVQKLLGALLADPSETTGGTSRGDTYELRMRVTEAILAASLNHEAFGSKRSQPGCFGYGMIYSGFTSSENAFVVEGINSVLLQNTDSEILDRMTDEFLEKYFQGQEYSTEPDPELAQELADLSYWDLFAEEPAEEPPEVEEEPLTTPEPDFSEITFAHRVGDTDCPQYIGSVFLEDAGVEGEWAILDQPEWLNVELDDNFAEFYFNCFIEDTSSHTIEDEVELEFFAEDPEFEEEIEIEILVVGEIINEEDE
jgi:hypothetical protein